MEIYYKKFNLNDICLIIHLLGNRALVHDSDEKNVVKRLYCGILAKPLPCIPGFPGPYHGRISTFPLMKRFHCNPGLKLCTRLKLPLAKKVVKKFIYSTLSSE